MKKVTFNLRLNNKNYSFYAVWNNEKKVKSIFSSNFNGSYNGEINLFGKHAINFIDCLNKADLSSIGNKHEAIRNYNNDCILTYNDENKLSQNKWDMYTFPKNVDYLYTAIALCDSKFLNIFKRQAC